MILCPGKRMLSDVSSSVVMYFARHGTTVSIQHGVKHRKTKFNNLV